MTAIRKRSSILIMIVIFLLVLLGSGGFYTIYLTHTIKTDAEITNKLGIIRGSLQRLSKLELAGIQDDELIQDIDLRINEFKENKIKLYDKKNEIQYALGDLCGTWTPLKESIYTYRTEQSSQSKKVLLEESEEAWTKSNSMVMASQLVSRNKVDKYQTSFMFFGTNLILGVVLIFLIKRYVKDTLEHLVNYDGLTKVYNRRYFNEYLNHEMEKSERYNKNLSLIMFDIDHFKKVNDTYGHDVGDSVLKELSDLIQAHIRKCDILARIGGEEFAIIATETNVDNGLVFSEKLRKIVEEYDFKHIGKITISLGVTQFNHGDNSDLIYKRADTALYKAKNNGRNRSEIEIQLSYKTNS
ncbi:GGDEF domain-containing protein [Anaerosolibacter sp.]|uniref:GGDEF domain-containing protein n=1 Tax=Anaerosolibacter sp. TaxID=1872527 RepID=UPI0039EE8B81